MKKKKGKKSRAFLRWKRIFFFFVVVFVRSLFGMYAEIIERFLKTVYIRLAAAVVLDEPKTFLLRRPPPPPPRCRFLHVRYACAACYCIITLYRIRIRVL